MTSQLYFRKLIRFDSIHKYFFLRLFRCVENFLNKLIKMTLFLNIYTKPFEEKNI